MPKRAFPDGSASCDEERFDIPGSAADCGLGHRLRRASCDDVSAFVARAGTDVDDPVAGGDDVDVVLDDDDGVAGVDQAIELRDEALDVGRMESGGGLVEDVEGVSALRALELGGELDALGFAAARVRWLAGPGADSPARPR